MLDGVDVLMGGRDDEDDTKLMPELLLEVLLAAGPVWYKTGSTHASTLAIMLLRGVIWVGISDRYEGSPPLSERCASWLWMM